MKPKKNRLYNIGSKFGNSIHTQLRLNCSQLNSHLYSFGLSLSPNCLCQAQETTKHFMLDCFIFSIERNELFEKLEGVLERKHTDNYSKTELLQILLQGEKPEIYENAEMYNGYNTKANPSRRRSGQFRQGRRDPF